MSFEPELSSINNIYSSQGNSKKDWESLAKEINNDSYIDKIVFFLQKNMKENPKNEITLDIIDLIVDFGSPNFLFKIAQKDFLDLFLNLLRSETNAGLENQKKVIFLTQKWANKFSKNKTFSIFTDNYNFLKKNGITFPPESFVINTYDKYISQEEIKNCIYGNQNQNMNQNNNNNFNNQNNNNSEQNFPNINDSNNNANHFPNDNSIKQSFPMPKNDGFPGSNDNNNNNNNNNPFNNFNNNNNNSFDKNNNNFNNNNNSFNNNNNFNNNNYNPFDNNNNFNNNNNPYINNNSNFNNNNNYNNIFNDNYNNMNSNFNNNNFNNNFSNYNRSNSSPNDFNNNPYNPYATNNNYSNFGNDLNMIKSKSSPFNSGYNSYSNNFSSSTNLIDTWKQKIKTYNSYIEEGKFSYHSNKLKEGIKEILDSFPSIDKAINECNDNSNRRDLTYIKYDMEQTCHRYECLKNDKKVEPFMSAFDGNNRRYSYNGANLFKEKEYIPYAYVEKENKVLSGLERFGNTIKDGACLVGQKIKDAAVGGYDYVKDKWDGK